MTEKLVEFKFRHNLIVTIVTKHAAKGIVKFVDEWHNQICLCWVALFDLFNSFALCLVDHTMKDASGFGNYSRCRICLLSDLVAHIFRLGMDFFGDFKFTAAFRR